MLLLMVKLRQSSCFGSSGELVAILKEKSYQRVDLRDRLSNKDQKAIPRIIDCKGNCLAAAADLEVGGSWYPSRPPELANNCPTTNQQVRLWREA